LEDKQMLRVTVELVPGGAEALRRTISVMIISNISELADPSNYHVSVMEEANHLAGTPAQVRTFTVLDHARRQSVWKLLARVTTEIESVEPTEL
jgi:hypothetical protein